MTPESRPWCGRGARVMLLALMAVGGPVTPAMAQGGFLFQGVSDLELWKTDSASSLLARNRGHPGPTLRADLWAAIEPFRNVIIFGEVLGETGSARDPRTDRATGKQYALRFSPSDAFSIETGKIQPIVGTFPSRQLSFRNPLIGTPDGYSPEYPLGVLVAG